MIKNILNTAKNFRAPFVFHGKRRLFKKFECKKYIPYSKKFLGNSVYQASARCSKILNNKKHIFNTVKNIRATLFFQGKR